MMGPTMEMDVRLDAWESQLDGIVQEELPLQLTLALLLAEMGSR